MYECPVGYILREAPYTYDLLDRLRLTEHMGPLEFGQMPRYFQGMMRIHSNSREWIREQVQLQRDIAAQARSAHG